MNVPESWLRSFCNPKLSGAQLADKLTMAGLEVEAYQALGGGLSAPVVVGEVVSVEKHPNADKLTVCRVNTGKQTVQVVCGAPNVRPGMKAPLAQIGAKSLMRTGCVGQACALAPPAQAAPAIIPPTSSRLVIIAPPSPSWRRPPA